ncbi:NAD(P)-dependent dehydrogenase (short-subunit alcohol dehydrogenase family) [Evansella vedderi]|uniref:NAD(P)-dependent dehydrogenase (Short-subunit alcohol dehydrogenase family) n=1 Tax=Evansella vedderi TaxID=38282 RepID=A0ABT9ZRD8_9BACI|nr:SDR family NAD(P)-dependent oxidoreductase [Evansella vedderi]MDQ0253434.1 NAD(P)-dependent dehydrogenase (short-subunit alcohol dehydrogenase family) [Evansella vedderi]
MSEFKGKVAIVTGGASGMGKAVAKRLIAYGARVCIFDISMEKIHECIKQINGEEGQAMAVVCDISDAKDVEQGVKDVMEQWGRLDMVFANAGIAGTLAPIETMDIEEWDKTIGTNVRGTFATVKYSIPYLKEDGGSIVINSSVSGNRVFSQAGFCAYSTSKAAEVAFMKMAALELAQYKIRVNTICPGAIKTNIGESIHKSKDLKEVSIPMEFPEGDQPLEHRPGSVEQVADLVEFLLSPRSSHITGTEIYIDGGESLLRG